MNARNMNTSTKMINFIECSIAIGIGMFKKQIKKLIYHSSVNVTNDKIHLKLFSDYIVVTPNKVELGPKVKENDWSDLLRQYWLLLVVVCICALIIVLMPIIGYWQCSINPSRASLITDYRVLLDFAFAAVGVPALVEVDLNHLIKSTIHVVASF